MNPLLRGTNVSQTIPGPVLAAPLESIQSPHVKQSSSGCFSITKNTSHIHPSEKLDFDNPKISSSRHFTVNDNTDSSPPSEEGYPGQSPFIVIPPISDRVPMRKFGGYTHEEGTKFLEEFESYITFNGLHFDPSPQRKIAAFHMHLIGPARVWFHALDSASKSSWTELEKAFREKYTVTDSLDPALLVESASFHRLKWHPGQPLEEYHSIILEKGLKLGKPMRDMVYQFIEGLTPSLAFFVRSGMCTDLQSALLRARSGEASGYCNGVPGMLNPPLVAAVSKSETQKSDIEELKSQVQALTSLVQGLQVSPQKDSTSSTHCYRCKGMGHRQRDCRWTGHGESRPQDTCQLCNQRGHVATQCVKNINITQPPPPMPTYPASVNWFPPGIGRGHSGGY